MTIAPPNYTQIPNVFFDYWMKELSSYSFVVLMCLSRKIFGWHKTSDRISKNQICKATGLSKNQVQKSVEELEAKKLIIKYQETNEYGNQPNSYALNIHKLQDTTYSDHIEGGGRSQYDPGVGHNMTQGVGHNMTPQKEDLTKKTLTKEKEREGVPPVSPPTPTKKEKLIERDENVSTTEKEHQHLLSKFDAERVQRLYNRLSLWKMDTPKAKWKKSDFRSILRWVIVADEEDLKRGGKWKLTKRKEQSEICKDTSLEKNLSVQPLQTPGLIMSMLQD